MPAKPALTFSRHRVEAPLARRRGAIEIEPHARVKSSDMRVHARLWAPLRDTKGSQPVSRPSALQICGMSADREVTRRATRSEKRSEIADYDGGRCRIRTCDPCRVNSGEQASKGCAELATTGNDEGPTRACNCTDRQRVAGFREDLAARTATPSHGARSR